MYYNVIIFLAYLSTTLYNFLKKNLQLLNFSLCNHHVNPFYWLLEPCTNCSSPPSIYGVSLLSLWCLSNCACSPPVFSGVRVTRSLGLYVCFAGRCLSFCTFSCGHCVVCPSSIYGSWLPLWYLQTVLVFLCPILHTWETCPAS